MTKAVVFVSPGKVALEEVALPTPGVTAPTSG